MKTTEIPTRSASYEAAILQAHGFTEKETAEHYTDQEMDEASSAHLRGCTLRQLIHATLDAANGESRRGGFTNETIQEVLIADQRIQVGGFSTVSLSGTLGNVANKVLLKSFGQLNRVARQICHLTDVNDFKASSRYRVTGIGAFTPVGPNGELKTITLGEESYTTQVDTRGAILALTRQMIINDDLGAFLAIPKMLGRQAAIAEEKAVFELLLANAGTHFSTGNGNCFEGSSTNLQISSLSTGEQLFADQVDSNGDPIFAQPKYLLVPTTLRVDAQQLMKETRVNETTTTNKPVPANNPHAGKWEPLSSPYLNSQGLSGQSSTSWYLFADPEEVGAIDLAFLQGNRNPTIERGETSFNTLGVQWRSYFDFGVAWDDTRGAVKSKGAA